ncbi:MAG: pro-sigmaK processing inhibitor BofA family protein [Defluviitaleaceae bacterium]|nr:pro-sigmaK processing inhibitor BofA family protein [Defluviitaleaceae bacterium]
MGLYLLLAFGVAFFIYLLYSRQVKWLVGVIRNSAIGVVGILVFNFFFAGFGLAVGVNAVTALVVGLLGAPGFLLLYAAQLLIA